MSFPPTILPNLPITVVSASMHFRLPPLDFLRWTTVCLLGLSGPWLLNASADEPAISFNQDIRSILSENCYFCHGPDENNRQAGLRLDVREEAIDYAAIVPEDVDGSELVARIDHEDPELVMPPPDSHKTLTEKQKQLLKAWIAQGAPYEEHWSFSLIQRPEVPDLTKWDETVESNDVHPVDAFIRARLLAKGHDLSGPARPDRLLRRLHLDLVGLPPTWEETQDFFTRVQETQASADARSSLIDQRLNELFETPHHGERMAAFWLDLVRFADTVGYHGDQNQHIFPYRDWVIDASQNNMPFDEFTIKQLAGDLLPNPKTDDLIASGFNRLNMITREGGAQPGEYLSKYATDRVRTVGMAWMGLTTGCAECHDHKFDPFTAKDFYSLGAFFADIEQWGVYSDYGYTPNPDLKGYNNNFPFPPEIEVTSPALLREQTQAKQELIDLARLQLAALSDDQKNSADDWLNNVNGWLEREANGWQSLPMTSAPPKDKNLKAWTADSESISLGSLPPQSIQVSLLTAANQSPQNVEIRFYIEEIKPPATDDSGSEKSKDEKKEEAKPTRTNVAVSFARANRWLPSFSSTVAQQNVASRWSVPATDAAGRAVKQRPHQFMIDQSKHADDPMRAVFELAGPLQLKEGQSLVAEIKGLAGDTKVRFEASPLIRMRPFDAAELEAIQICDSISQPNALLSWMMSNPKQAKDAGAIKHWRDRYLACRDGRTWTMVTQATEPMEMRVLPRGNWQDKSGDVVEPATPGFLGSYGIETAKEANAKDAEAKRLTRLDLARWIVHRDNPLTARVVANRLWKQFFGVGLTAAVDDLGAQGDPPSHPELLDYLAIELIDSGWDLRHVTRLILTSRTYQQDSRVRPELSEIDPENRLLSYHPPRRLEAEIVRDNALAVSGLLNLEIGGPSVKPYQPDGYYSNLQFPNRSYRSTAGDNQYRRGIYMHWQRTFLHPMLANFDAPSREDCVAIRANANTPQQALTLLNDPTFIEAASELAWNMIEQKESDETRLRTMVRRSLQRDATSEEIERLTNFLNQQRELFLADEALSVQLTSIGQSAARHNESLSQADRAEWAAWTATARIVLNLHETITRY
ncbi:protein containing planctomycete cytochrome C domain protein [Rhodopirellula baltica SH28]|uniref:Protein containing planctomycete cytochrome C domain protein n=1 Tax=Rhodopirellula baltica SH28 TaxID=993517 RepID=K5E517_RHOBT|nr:PSD1 and planctomycete cytochrome C domain-containing protein [Rhodopirellula baltica]EKK00876.1 protein containing planctomycete cytochrome C domain protein [Rhodopirellula baltica SH28]